MASQTKRYAGRMRTADSHEPDFHLLEELARPPACVNGGRICAWVYRQEGRIREIVISGHAEVRTCSQATSLLIEAAKELDGDVDWMLTCGAAYFRLPETGAPAAGDLPPWLPASSVARDPRLQGLLAAMRGPGKNEAALGQMLEALQELERENGLVRIVERQWPQIEELRQRFLRQKEASPPRIVLPRVPPVGRVADFLPISPDGGGTGDALVFHLEGWDFDCPEYQLVADVHLRSMRRELLKDALRRRRTYRIWLKEWLEDWVRRAGALPEEQARAVTLSVPPPIDGDRGKVSLHDVGTFLEKEVAGFLDPGQDWHRRTLFMYRAQSFGSYPEAELDRPIRSDRIIEVDFERGIRHERAATAEDRPHTYRERLTRSRPGLLSQCLLFIRRMDAIIQPYERLRTRASATESAGGPADSKDRGIRLVGEISRQIVIETMIRGWPSFYLQDEEDRAVFDAWAKQYRPHVWSIMARQAEQAGVALEPLLEDNVVYRIRFGDDLGCTVQPLMLVDDAAHAQVHGSRAGASVVVPVWTRRRAQEQPPPVLALGKTNSQRAQCLVQRATRLAENPAASTEQLAHLLRQALACHPAEAGRLILEQWSQRLGRDTGADFGCARRMVEAAELCASGRWDEARAAAESYLAAESRPIPDAHVVLAFADLIGEGDHLEEFRKTVTRRDEQATRHNELLAEHHGYDSNVTREEEALGRAVERFLEQRQNVTFAPHRHENQLQLLELRKEIEHLDQRAEDLQQKVEEQGSRRRRLIKRALARPSSVAPDYPALAQAAKCAAGALRGTLETNAVYRPEASETLFRRYGAIRGIIEVRGLFEIIHQLQRIAYRVEQDPLGARRRSLEEMDRLARHLWLPKVVEKNLKALADEFRKGEWDRLQANSIRAVLTDAYNTCLARIRDLMSDLEDMSAPFAEYLATRLHITQTMEAKFLLALTMLLEAKVVFGRAVTQPWQVLEESLKEPPEGASFGFDAASGTVYLETGEGRTPLLRAAGLERLESGYVDQLVADLKVPPQVLLQSPNLAEALLRVEVEPPERWRRWRDAMARLGQELLIALSYFDSRANLLPEWAPELSSSGQARMLRMDRLTPMADPVVDWVWSDLGGWSSLVGPGVERLHSEVY